MSCDFSQDQLLSFAQRLQVALGLWSLDNNLNSLDRIWSGLMGLPHATTFDERCAIAAISSRVAWGLTDRLDRWFLNQHVHARYRRLSVTKRVEQLIHLTWKRHREYHLTLAALASHMHMSEPYLSRALSRVTTHHFASHLSGMRITDAIILLHSAALSVKEVATQSGFSSTGELDRHFQSWFRMTPNSFRQAALGDTNREHATHLIGSYIRRHPDSLPSELADILGVRFGIVNMILSSMKGELHQMLTDR